ncbi:spermidine/putrescine transport system ATP-binding protein [Micromonospora rhizosphaerae]|uniref:Spermidine/putrescine import ATP-binding protein PotA n=1 Tax=Micromonospora rhizosphaerae TaxID=568872 RepID=A0A1C6SYB9_9ACTN|nr:ABC transporter ATP-binding protein [Micromonospora rhizosphaerae]SCL34312.1 spermidine/putrescine transport system ATP-binding protein [Micromonospora rhizosphaerae]
MNTVLSLTGISKSFGKIPILHGVDLEVHDGEILSLLGPSGCGKTTLLRIIGGFERPDRGRVVLAGKDITDVPPHRRPVNIVFQRYLLFPHLSVFDNVAFGLRIDKVGKQDIERRVREALELVGLEELADRRATQLSGGQSQRISLARALVKRPKVLLLDEPLSALDQKVRINMQAELRRIHRETGTTFVYVTHDQQEAMSLSNRVVVMNAGRIEQIGTPAEVYHRSATKFVSGFVGDANLMAVEVLDSAGDGAEVKVVETGQRLRLRQTLPQRNATLVVRPELLRLSTAADEGLSGTISDIAFLGSCVQFHVDLDGMTLRVQEPVGGTPLTHDVGDSVGVVLPDHPVHVLTD